MSRTRTLVAASPFGIWLDSQMTKLNTYQKQVAIRSGLAQSTIAGYLSGTRNPDNADLVHKVVRGLLPEDAATLLAEQTLHDALTAAGFSAPPLSPAAALVREKLAGYQTRQDIDLTADQMDALITDLERYAEMRLQLTAEQSRGKQEKTAA